MGYVAKGLDELRAAKHCDNQAGCDAAAFAGQHTQGGVLVRASHGVSPHKWHRVMWSGAAHRRRLRRRGAHDAARHARVSCGGRRPARHTHDRWQ